MSEKSRKKMKSWEWKSVCAVFLALLMIGAMAYTTSAKAAEPQVIKLKFSSSFFPPEPPNLQAYHTLERLA